MTSNFFNLIIFKWLQIPRGVMYLLAKCWPFFLGLGTNKMGHFHRIYSTLNWMSLSIKWVNKKKCNVITERIWQVSNFLESCWISISYVRINWPSASPAMDSSDWLCCKKEHVLSLTFDINKYSVVSVSICRDLPSNWRFRGNISKWERRGNKMIPLCAKCSPFKYKEGWF